MKREINPKVADALAAFGVPPRAEDTAP